MHRVVAKLVSRRIWDAETGSSSLSYSTMAQPFKYPRINKICPICGIEFTVSEAKKKNKTTCSHSCANTYFRSGKSNPNYKEDDDLAGAVKYVRVCFRHHEKKCVCCDESNVVEVHHYDGNKTNNSPENLIPLCPTHHQYWHSKFKYLIEQKVHDYVETFKETL